MRFQRHLAPRRALPRGYSAPFTGEENFDQAVFRLGGGPVEFETDKEGCLERISVQGRLRPIVYAPKGPIHAIVQNQGKDCEPYELYKANKALERYGSLQSFEIHFERFLTQGLGEEFRPLSSLLIRKEFKVQAESPCVLKQEILMGQSVMTPPGTMGKKALWAYGGYYQPGCGLSEIEQIVFTPMREHEKTGLHLSRLSSWHTKDHDIVWVNPLEERQKFSLLGDIEQGAATFDWFQGSDEQGNACSVRYQSFAVYQRDRLSDLVEMEFYREGK
ncbi:hypothetical protein [Candidatus Finniella inopinata]|uniref:Uncharacterized protein n=1 Tax=Candidatus Finniella inopinata TaxID=1696036 RepID=A0A4Q7DJP8_9PROT|nr:hypothetical protein [Candidatus Finniella inopinata]RZI46568.1 hypothetical protein EQU50_02990 [Candidatus Finniella inopinata]